MKIASRQESTIDYPGEFGIIMFTQGCNFNCGFCHNPEFINTQGNEINLKKMIQELKTKKKWYSAICISGGEPTLHKKLPKFIKELKQIGFKIKLDTNGTNPEMLKILLNQNLIDYIAMDIKSPKEKYPEITNSNVNIENLNQSIELAKKFPVCEFRTTVLPFLTEKDFKKMGEWINQTGKPKLWTLQQFSPEKTLDKEYEKLIPKTKQEIIKISEIIKNYAEKIRLLID